MIYIPLFVYETGFHGAQNRSDSPSNYDPEGLILLSPPLESSDDRYALPHPDWDSHEQFLSSQATDGEQCTALIQRHLMSIVFHVFTLPFCSCCGRGCITPLFSRTELALSVPFSLYLLVSVSLPQSGGASPFVEVSVKATSTVVGFGCCTGTMSALGMRGYFLKQRGLGLHRLGRMKPLLSELLQMHPQRTPQTSPP